MFYASNDVLARKMAIDMSKKYAKVRLIEDDDRWETYEDGVKIEWSGCGGLSFIV